VAVALTPSRLERPARPGDLLTAVTESGASSEVLQRVEAARKDGLRTVAFTAVAGSAVTRLADNTVVIAGRPEGLRANPFVERHLRPVPPAPPGRSSFCLSTLLVLEAAAAVLKDRLGRTDLQL